MAGPLRPLGSFAYGALTRAAALYLRWGRREAAVYAGRSVGSGEVLPGLSDIDLLVVVPDDPGGGGGEHLRISRRLGSLARRAPLIGRQLLSDTAVYEDGELRAAIDSTLLTFGLGEGRAAGPAALFGAHPPLDDAQLRMRPGLPAPMADWRLISGPERRPPPPPRDRQRLRISAWLELVWWWRVAFDAVAEPDAPWAAYSCVKMVSEPARVWLTLSGEPVGTRAQVLLTGAARLPELEPAFEEAIELLEALPRLPDPPLARFLAHLVSLSERIARLLAEQVAAEGTTPVRLAGKSTRLALPRGIRGRDQLLPLMDWRGLVAPALPDEALRPQAESGLQAGALVEAVRSPEPAVYPAQRSPELLVLPVSDTVRRGILRAAQMRLTDPVSFALLEGSETALFPNVEGWSARDWAGRAVAEHAAWLSRSQAQRLGSPTAREWLDPDGERAAPETRALAKLLTAARAALFHDSVASGEPELPLTVAATCEQLSARGSAAAAVARAALESYRAARAGEIDAAPRQLLAPLHELVLALPAYAGVGSAP